MDAFYVSISTGPWSANRRLTPQHVLASNASSLEMCSYSNRQILHMFTWNWLTTKYNDWVFVESEYILFTTSWNMIRYLSIWERSSPHIIVLNPQRSGNLGQRVTCIYSARCNLWSKLIKPMWFRWQQNMKFPDINISETNSFHKSINSIWR